MFWINLLGDICLVVHLPFNFAEENSMSSVYSVRYPASVY